MGLVFNWFAQILLSASTSASTENKHKPRRHPSHCAPFVHTMLMVLVDHSVGSVVGSLAGSSGVGVVCVSLRDGDVAE